MKQTVNTKIKKSNKTTLLSGYIDFFILKNFNEFVISAKKLWNLAPEVLLAFDIFMNILNIFFSTIKEDFDIQSKVKWFKIC